MQGIASMIGSMGINGSPKPWPNKANAAFIVRAVNSHDELVAHLRDAVAVIQSLAGRYGHTLKQYSPMIKRIDEVIAKAEGKE